MTGQMSMQRTDLPDGTSVLSMPYSEDLAQKAVKQSLPGDGTPEPSGEAPSESRDQAGPITRFNDVFSDLGSTYLEAMGMDGFEVSKAIQTRRDEIFRNEFPVILPRFRLKCTECTAEYDERVEECDNCGSADLREPDSSERLDAKRLFESVNKEGQSLRDLMEACEDDHGRVGVAALVITYDYVTASGTETALGKPVVEEGEVIRREPDELVKADPKRLVPVTDGNGRLGGWRWACPVHREEAEDSPGTCDLCGARLEEVCFAEKDHVRSGDATKLYFNHEVVTWAHFYPRLHGLDGLSPVHHVWMKQAILHWMDVYAGAFYDPNSDKYPNKFMVVHTTNADAWERNFQQSQDEADENLYANKILVNEYGAESQSTPEMQVLDLMDDELLGQDEQIKKQYKSDIRTQFGVTDVFDSELEDAGGLNNEGLQLEVTDRAIASAQQELADGPLDELMKNLGFDDWRLAFVPADDRDLDDLEQKIGIGEDAVGAGLDARLENGELEVDDGDFEESDEEGGMGGLFSADPGEGAPLEGLEQAAEPNDVRTFRVVAPEDTETDFEDDVLAWGAELPYSGVYVDWQVDAWPDGQELGGPHVSQYDSIEDAAKVAEGDIVWDDEGSEEPDDPMDDLEQAAEQLRGGLEHIAWADETTKAEPFWDDAGSVPERVREAVEKAIEDGAVFEDIDGVPDDKLEDLRELLKEKLSDAAGWSLESLRDAVESVLDVEPDRAEAVVRTESASVLNNAQEDVYEDLEEDRGEPLKYEWIGPDDHRTTDACSWLAERTEGGVTMEELVELEREAQERFFPQLDEFRRHVVHPNERHTFTQTFDLKSEVAGAAGEAEVEVETVPGGLGAVVDG